MVIKKSEKSTPTYHLNQWTRLTIHFKTPIASPKVKITIKCMQNIITNIFLEEQ